MTFLVTVVSPLLIGYLFVRTLLPGMKPAWAGALFHLSLGAGCGMGLLSLLHFLVLLTVGPSLTALWICEIALLGVACAAYAMSRDGGTMGEDRAPSLLGATLGASLIAAAVAWIRGFAHTSEAMPHGQWDAWAIWNLRAAFLAQSGEAWRGAFSPLLQVQAGGFATHADYPLMLSGFIGRCWALTGTTGDSFIPTAVAGMFSLATVGLLVGSLNGLRGWAAGAIGGVVLLSNATFAANTASQNADVPLSFFYLATFALLLMAEAGGGRALALAGFTAGCAAWTKDEGQVFALVVCLALTLCAALSKLSWTRLGRFAIGAALPLAVTFYFKVALAPGGGWKGLTLNSALRQLAEWQRYSQIAAAFWKEGLAMGQDMANPAMLAALALLGLGISRTQLRAPLLRAALGVWAAMCAAYFIVYVVTPFDLTWHLATSLGRVLMQLAPSAAFLAIAVARTAQEAEIRSLEQLQKRKRA